MIDMLIFFKIISLTFNTQTFQATQIIFSHGMKLPYCISFNEIHVLKSEPWEEFSEKISQI